jgi:hypothetical protein
MARYFAPGGGPCRDMARIHELRPTARTARLVSERSRERSLLCDRVSNTEHAHCISYLFGNLHDGDATFSNIDATNAAAFPPAPAPDIYLEDLIDDFDDVHRVSLQPLVVD